MSESSTEEPTTPTFVASEPPPEPEMQDDLPLVPYAPRFMAVMPHLASPGVFIQWKEPMEAPATKYVITASNGASITVGGDQTQIDLLGLTPGEEITITVQAVNGTKKGSLTSEPVRVDGYLNAEG